MIGEMRTYDPKPRPLPAVEKRFGEAYEHRKIRMSSAFSSLQ